MTLPTGTKVKLWGGFIEVIPSLSDYNKVEGLCGTLDNDCSNDFVLADGSTSTHAKATQTACDHGRFMDRHFHPNDFAASWRCDTIHYINANVMQFVQSDEHNQS